MYPITLLMLTLGALFAASGTAGFALVYQQHASTHDLTLARAAATAGRWMSIAGLILFTTHRAAAGPGLAALLAVAALAVASYLTKSTTTPRNSHPNSSANYP